MELKKKNKLLIYVISLLILNIFAIALTSFNTFWLLLASVISAFVIELLFALIRKKKINILNWLVTPLLFVLFIPASAPIWLPIYGTMFAVLFAKAIFGGDDYYVFNPAMVGIVFVSISFPVQMPNMVGDLILVNETFRLLILFLGFILIAFKVIDWKIPIVFLGTFFFLTAFFKLLNVGSLDPLTSVYSGTVLLGAFFVATDEPTVAKYPLGKIIYAVGLALMVFVIRTFSSHPDGLPHSILLMNMLAPLIDKIEEPKQIDDLKEAHDENWKTLINKKLS